MLQTQLFKSFVETYIVAVILLDICMPKYNASRRDFIKKSAVSGIGAITIGSGFLSVGTNLTKAAATTTKDYSKVFKKRSEETYDGYSNGQKMHISSAVGWYGSNWLDNDGLWQHKFKANSKMRAEVVEYGSAIDHIDSHSLGVRNSDVRPCEALLSEDTEIKHGVYPKESDVPDPIDHYDEIYTLVSAVVSYSNPYVGTALTAAELATALVPEVGTGSSPDYNRLEEWSYSTGVSDASHYRHYRAETDANSSDFYIDMGAEGQTYGLSPSNSFQIRITADWTPQNITTSSFSSMSETEAGTHLFKPKEGWIVEHIPAGKVNSRGKQLGVPKDVRAQAEGSGNPLYHAHEMPIEVVR